MYVCVSINLLNIFIWIIVNYQLFVSVFCFCFSKIFVFGMIYFL